MANPDRDRLPLRFRDHDVRRGALNARAAPPLPRRGHRRLFFGSGTALGAFKSLRDMSLHRNDCAVVPGPANTLPS
jgi:hypothetical protein